MASGRAALFNGFPQLVAPDSPDAWNFHGLVGAHPRMRELFDAIEVAAPLDSPLLVEGETGVGKELVAEALHRLSGRSGKLVAVNVAALPDALADAELFGAERGAYTGATARRLGLVEEAAGGTLYLDEAGELSPSIQIKLLRVLETGQVRRLGSNTTRLVRFRLTLSVQRPAWELVETKRWRSDFFHRVSGIELRVPPLVERLSDVPRLANHFLHQLGQPTLDPEAFGVLLAYDWPGNVRELRRVVERARFRSAGSPVTAEHLAAALQPARAPASGRSGPSRTLRDVEREHIELTLRESDYDVQRTATVLGISKSALYRRLATLGITAPRWRTDV